MNSQIVFLCTVVVNVLKVSSCLDISVFANMSPYLFACFLIFVRRFVRQYVRPFVSLMFVRQTISPIFCAQARRSGQSIRGTPIWSEPGLKAGNSNLLPMASGFLLGQLQLPILIPFVGRPPAADPPSQPSSPEGGGSPPLDRCNPLGKPFHYLRKRFFACSASASNSFYGLKSSLQKWFAQLCMFSRNVFSCAESRDASQRLACNTDLFAST